MLSRLFLETETLRKGIVSARLGNAAQSMLRDGSATEILLWENEIQQTDVLVHNVDHSEK